MHFRMGKQYVKILDQFSRDSKIEITIKHSE